MADSSLTLKILGDGSHAASVLDGLMGRMSATNKAFDGKDARAASKAYGGAANAVVKFNRQGSKVAEVGDRLQSVGQSLTNNVTKPLVSAGRGALKMGMQFDRVGALTGLERTGKGFEKLEKQALHLAAQQLLALLKPQKLSHFLQWRASKLMTFGKPPPVFCPSLQPDKWI